MICQRCASNDQKKLSAEMAVRQSALQNFDRMGVIFLYHEILVCLACGFTEFTVSNNDCDNLRLSA